MDPSAVRERFDRPVLAAVLGVTALALLARLLLLDLRISHFDEARVAYGTLRYLKTGAWSYDPSVHGPFLFHVNKAVFWLLGPSDFSARLVVALVGGSLPATAWLFREHLRDGEVVALALVFAADPVLLYYSRFMRNDLLVATFSIAGLGLLVRLLDTGRTRYLYAGVLSFAIAFTAKENAVLYPVTIFGALGLLYGHRLLARWRDPMEGLYYTWDLLIRIAHGLWRLKGAIVASAVAFVAIFAFFYAPRLAPVGGMGLWNAVLNPSHLPAVLEEATVGTVSQIERLWFLGPFQQHDYWPYLGHMAYRFGVYSWPLALFAVLGYLSDLVLGDGPTDLVSLGFYAGVASVIGYPEAMSVPAAWTLTHVFVFLAFPAAAGIARCYRRMENPGVTRDRAVAAGLAVLLATAGVYTVAADVQTSYRSPQQTDLAQYSQPAGDMRPALTAAQNASRHNQGLDVLYYGQHLLVENESKAYRLGVPDGEWYNRLPLPWYFEIANATIDSVSGDDLGGEELTDAPPVVVTCATHPSCPGETERQRIAGHLDGYVAYPPYEARYSRELAVFEFVFYVDERYVPPGERPTPGES